MNKTLKVVLIIIALIIIVGLIWSGVKQTQQNNNSGEKQTVKIGVILPLSGSSAFMGEAAKNAVLLAQEKLTDTKFNYELVFEDDQLETKFTSNAITKLINVDRVDAVISFSSGSGNVVAPMTQNNKTLHVGIASDSNIAKGEYNFIHWTPPASEAEKWVEEVQKRGYKKVAFLGMNQQGLIAVLDAVKSEIKGTNIQLVNEQLFNMGTKDFKVIIEKAKQANPDIVLIQCFSPDLEIFAKQYQELGIEIPLTSIEAFEFSEQMELFEGRWYIQGAENTPNFNTAFQGKYNDDPQLGSAFGYDAFNLIVEAYERAGSIDNQKAINQMNQIKDFPSAVGLISVGKDGIVWSEAVVREIRNGKPVTIGK